MIGNSQNASSFASTADYFREVERARAQALVGRDMELLWQLHALDYQLITPTGRAYSRDRYLRDIDTGSLRYLRWELGPIDVKATAQMAMVRYQAVLELDAGNGRGSPFQCWHTDAYELRDGTWQAVWSQATAIR